MPEAAALKGRVPELAKYEILEEIGHGGMATVYRARDKRLGREVALKVIHPHLRDSTEVASRFFAEAKAVAKLRHPNIVEVYDVSEATEPEQYLVAELVRGTTLRRLQQQRGPMPPELAAAVAMELLDALAHANAAGVVHRDVKPENVLIEHRAITCEAGERAGNGSGQRVAIKLTDFGIAKLLDAQGVTSTGQVLGSPAHMAPEQIEGGDVDARSDVFGLGVLLYECMVGHLPFEGTNPAQVLRRVLDGDYPPALVERPLVGTRWSRILDQALAHAPADRFADATSMSKAIAAELERLGFLSPRRELELWLDEPEAYEAAYAKRIVERLCALADEARRHGNALSSASDYNRALAHAPDDARLMRIVAGLNRSEARARTVRRAGVVLALAGVTSGTVWFASRFLHARAASESATSTESSDVMRHVPRPPVASALGLPVASAVGAPSAGSVPPNLLAPTANAQPHEHESIAPAHIRDVSSPKASEDRQLTLDLKPPMGVDVSVDALASRAVSTGDTLTVDSGAHVLVFSCPVCASVQLSIAAGDKSERLVVAVPVKPATLLIDGNATKTYQIIQHPEIAVRAGANTLALKSAYEHVTVKEIETGVSVTVRLEAGKTIRASFE